MSLHQVEFAREFTDRIVGLSMGKVVFDGKPEALSSEYLAAIYADSRPTAEGLQDELLQQENFVQAVAG